MYLMICKLVVKKTMTTIKKASWQNLKLVIDCQFYNQNASKFFNFEAFSHLLTASTTFVNYNLLYIEKYFRVALFYVVVYVCCPV
jgi:hypothetical protein